MRAAPAVSCARCTKENAHEHTGSAEAIRHSLRNGSTAYSVLSPAIRICLSPSPRGYGFVRPVGPAKPPRDLTPTMRRQDHTLLPYASTPFVCAPSDRSRIDKIRPAIQPCARAPPRPPLPAPTFVTMANAPLPGRDGKPHRLICISDKQNYFCIGDWTGQITLIRFDKSDFWRKRVARWQRES